MVNYHDRTEFSRSDLAMYLESSREFEDVVINGNRHRFDETKETIIGSLTHQQVLEPELESAVMIIPLDVLNKDGHKKGDAWKKFKAENDGKALLKQDEYDEAMGCVKAIRRKISGLINSPNAVREHEIYWTHERTGLKLRAKLDLLVKDEDAWWLPDLKTCGDIKRFGKEVFNRALWLQHAHYRAAVKAKYDVDPHFWFCVVEKGGTNRVWHHELDEEASILADAKYETILDEIAEKIESNDWSEWQEHGTNKCGMVRLSSQEVFGYRS